MARLKNNEAETLQSSGYGVSHCIAQVIVIIGLLDLQYCNAHYNTELFRTSRPEGCQVLQSRTSNNKCMIARLDTILEDKIENLYSL